MPVGVGGAGRQHASLGDSYMEGIAIVAVVRQQRLDSVGQHSDQWPKA